MWFFYMEGSDAKVMQVKQDLSTGQLISWRDICQILVDHKNFPNCSDRLSILSEFAFRQIPKNSANQFYGELRLAENLEGLDLILKIATNNPSRSTSLSRIKNCVDDNLQNLSISFIQRGHDFHGILHLEKV